MKGASTNGISLQDTTPLSHVLSYSSDGDTGPDLLYNIISDIVRSLNVLHVLYSTCTCICTVYYLYVHKCDIFS